MLLYEKKVNAWKGKAQGAPPAKETAHHRLKVRAAGSFVHTAPERTANGLCRKQNGSAPLSPI